MRIATCNIRYYPANDGPNHWEQRKAYAFDVIRSLDADIICFQELWRPQCEYAQQALPEYAHFGIVDEPTTDNPLNSIFYRQDVFTQVSAGGFWLSDTPHITGSSAWDSACVRLANWLRLEVQTSGCQFRVINTHLDHKSQPARENQARLICEDAAAYAPTYPQLLTGDMNCDSANPAIQHFLAHGWRDTYNTIHGTTNPGHTFHRFQGPAFTAKADCGFAVGKMDWVFCRGTMEVSAATIVDDNCGGRFPSDHYFVTADITL